MEFQLSNILFWLVQRQWSGATLLFWTRKNEHAAFYWRWIGNQIWAVIILATVTHKHMKKYNILILISLE